MADKELSRPVGLEPSWSNDQSINDPGESWDTTDTKIEPGAGKRDDGWKPNEQPSAQHTNHLLNELGKWVQYLSNVQFRNWFSPRYVEEVPGATQNTCLTITRDMGGPAGGYWFVAGDSGTIHVSVDGVSWTLINSTMHQLDCSASKDPRDAPAMGGFFASVFGSSVGATVFEYVNGVLASRVVPGAGGINCLHWGGYGLFNAGGHDGATNPVIWSSNPTAMGWSTVGITKNQSEEVVDMAHDRVNGITVAIGDLPGGASASDIWTSTNGIGWTLVPDVFPSSAGEPRCIAYNHETGLWMVHCGAAGNVYTSSDGTIWSPLVTTGFSPLRRALHGHGSLWLTGNSSTRAIQASTDGGLTWTFATVDMDDRLGVLGNYTDLAYAEDLDAFGVLMEGGSGDSGQMRQSLSAGSPIIKMDGAGGLVFYTPTVT